MHLAQVSAFDEPGNPPPEGCGRADAEETQLFHVQEAAFLLCRPDCGKDIQIDFCADQWDSFPDEVAQILKELERHFFIVPDSG